MRPLNTIAVVRYHGSGWGRQVNAPRGPIVYVGEGDEATVIEHHPAIPGTGIVLHYNNNRPVRDRGIEEYLVAVFGNGLRVALSARAFVKTGFRASYYEVVKLIDAAAHDDAETDVADQELAQSPAAAALRQLAETIETAPFDFDAVEELDLRGMD